MMSKEVVEIVATPLFWLASAVGSVVLGILGNILTPKVLDYWEKRTTSQNTARKKERARLLGEVLLRFNDPARIVHTKLDAIYALLLACFTMLVALAFFAVASASGLVPIPEWIRLTFAILSAPFAWLAFFVFDHGHRGIKIARIVERRREALTAHLAKTDDTKATEYEFLAAWDFKEFEITHDEVVSVLSSSSAVSR